MANSNPHIYHTLPRWDKDSGTIRDYRKSQNWAIGQIVQVGFVKGLRVDAIEGGSYLLSVNGRHYCFAPYSGLARVE